MSPRSTFSASVALPESRIPEGPRRELRRGVSGADFELAGLALRAGDVPLFRRAGDGSLLQCVRVVVRAAADRGRTHLSLLAGERTLDAAEVELTRGEQVVRLFVPEVRSPRQLVLAVDDARLPLDVCPQRKWRVFLVHHSHLDVGYTDPQAQVLRNHLSYLDSVLDLAAATDAWPDAARFRWNVESNLPVERWLAARPAAARDELVERIREGRVEVCALPFTMHLEALSIDELARQLVFAGELRERHGVPVVTAMQTDVPGAGLGLAALLADAGVRYLSVAHNWAGRGAPYLKGGRELPRAFYWRSESGKRVLVWHTDSPHGVAYLEGNLLGLGDSAEETLALLPEYLAALQVRPYPYVTSAEALGLPQGLEPTRAPYPYDVLHLRVQGAIADNAAPSIVPAEVAREWDERWAFPELRLATNREFFTNLEQRHGDELEIYAGEWGDWWADGLGSSARSLGFNRRAQATLRTAQTLHALADVLVERDEGPDAEIERAYESMALFDEHTWCAAHPAGDALSGRESGALQWQAKAAFASEARDRAEASLEAATSRLAQLAPSSLLVVNPCPWPRTDVVRVFIPASRVDLGRPLAVRDEASGELVPQAVDAAGERNRPRGAWLSFVARDVPSVGYRRYALVPARTEPSAPPAGEALESEHYRVELDAAAGCIARLVDRELGLDLVDAGSAFGFGQYVYDRYTSALHATLRLPPGAAPSWAPSVGGLTGLLGSRSTAGYGVVTDRTSTAVEDRATIRLEAEGAAWLETTFRLVRGVRRLDVEYRLAKVATADKEGVHFVFPVAAHAPAVSYELTGGVGGPDAPHVPGSAAHVRAVRHWVSLADERATVAWASLEAPLVELGNVFLPYPPYPATVDGEGAGTIVSWVMNNVWDTNFPLAQGGETAFAYAVASCEPGANARALGLRTAAALTRPLVGLLGTRGGVTQTAAAGSFCALDRADVDVVALAASRSGHDLTVLLHSQAPDEVDLHVAFPDLPLAHAWAGTFLERDLRDVTAAGGARLRVGPGDLVALAVDLAPL